MSVQVELKLTDGRTITGINFSYGAADLPPNASVLAAGMQGGEAYGTYHIYGPNGWLYIPASQIAEVVTIKTGRPT